MRQTGSHRLYRKGDRTGVFAFHDREDLGGPMMARIARQFGYTLEELRRMVQKESVSKVARVRVEYVWDQEAGSWGFVVPALHIVGGGPTRNDARRRAREAIAFALEAGAGEDDGPDAQRT